MPGNLDNKSLAAKVKVVEVVVAGAMGSINAEVVPADSTNKEVTLDTIDNMFQWVGP